MEFLLLRSHRENELQEDEEDAAGEGRVFVGTVSDPDLGEISISAIPLKRGLPGWLKYSNNRVFHAVNGQVQHKQTRGYIAQTCGLPALKDRVVIIVDASELTFAAHNEVWKGDREHISNTIGGERYIQEVTAAIRESKALQELQDRVAKQELERATKAESNALFQRLVDADRNLAGLLSNRDPQIRLPAAGGKNGGESGGGGFEGKYSPTFVRLEEKQKEQGLAIPLDKTRPVGARTDAENEYLNRTDNRGRLLLPDAIQSKFRIRHHLHDGRLTVYLQPIDDQVKIGEKVTLKLALKDDAMAAPVESESMVIRIVEPEIKPQPSPKPKGNGKDKSGDGGKESGKGKDAPTHGLPACVLLTRDGRAINGYQVEEWPAEFTENEGGLIKDLGKGNTIYKINYDNAYHIKYREQQRGQVAKDVVTEKYILGMRILMLGYEHAFHALQEARGAEVNGVAEYSDDFRRMAARGAASTVLALAENLPKIIDASSVGAEADE